MVDKLKILIAEIVAGAVILLTLLGMATGVVGSLVTIPEADGVWLVLFLVMLLVIDIFLIVYTLRAWEQD
jgi:membrane protein implicated in regulation of membrane protease activity